MSKSGVKYYTNILVKGSLAVTIAEATTKIIGFVLLPIYSFYLTPEDYGIVSMVTITLTFFNLLYNPGLISATTRLYHNTENFENRQELIGSAQRFFLFFPLAITVIVVITGPFIFPLLFNNFEFYPYGLLAILLAFFTQPKRIWILFKTLQYELNIVAKYSVISVIISAVITVLLVVVLKMGALGKVFGLFPSAILLFIVSFKSISTYTQGKWSFKSLFNELKLGYTIIISIWSYEILHIADRYILERMTSMTNVGIYSFAYQIAQLPLFFVLGIRQLWQPIFYENMNKNDFVTLKILSEIYIYVLMFINLGLMLFSKEIILLLVNERYYDAIPVISMLILGVFLSSLLTLTNSILGYENKFKTISFIALFMSMINIGLNILLIPSYGIMGSAFSTTIAYLLYLVLSFLKAKKIAFKLKLFSPMIISSSILLLAYLIISYYDETSFNSNEFIIKVFFVLIIIFILFALKVISLSRMKQFLNLFKKL